MSHRQIVSRTICAYGRKTASRALYLLIVVAALGPISGCRHMKPSKAVANDSATLSIQLDKNAYRPGEAVVVKARLKNPTARTLKLRALDALSVAFFFSKEGTPEPMQRQAVFSPAEGLGRMIELAPGESKERDFLLTRLTYYAGPLKLVAIYDPNNPESRVSGGKLTPRITSNDARYTVSGEQLFAREPTTGLITQEEAGRLARQKAIETGLAGAEPAGIRAVKDERGFDKWYVNVDAPGKGLTGWLVNPYTGVVNQLKAPFAEKDAANPRLLRPGAPGKRQPAKQ